MLAMILVVFNLLGAVYNLLSSPGIVTVAWVVATIAVPICLFAPPVRAEFAAAKHKQRAG